ncbi:MAG TPA: universal stress protein [Chloroflexota bacterium]
MFQRLLVPLDGSHLAEAVLPICRRLEQVLHARVMLLHVLERGAPAEVHGERHLATVEEAERYLKEIADNLEPVGISVAWHAHPAPEGDVARSITAHAEEEGADLIVLATHGEGNVRQRIFGSIAQQVLQRGSIPVLLARPTGGPPPSFAPLKILVPLDATSDAEAALGPAKELARALGASLHLVTVVPTSGTIRGDRVATAILLPTATHQALELEQQEVQNYLEDLAAKLRAEALAVTTEVRRGEPSAALADEATEPDVGLVVVATHGRAGLQAAWAGSVTARLLSRTHAPVLLLRTVEG